jgi:hypothetical protein
MSEYSISKSTGKIRIGIDFDPSFVEQLEKLAEKEDRTLANLARVLIREAIVARETAP